MNLRNRRGLVVNAGLAAVLVAGAVGAWVVFGRDDTSQASPRTVAVARGDVSRTASASGNLVAGSETSVNFATSGTITEIRASVGAVVKKGAVLGRLDDTEATANLVVAKSNLASAQAGLTKAQADQDAGGSTGGTGSAGQAGQGSASSEEGLAAAVAQAQAQVDTAQRTVDQYESAITDSVLVAPVDGTVISVSGNVGSTAGSSGGSSGSSDGSSGGAGGGQAGSGGTGASGSSGGTGGSSGAFVVLADLAHLKVTASFSESDIAALKVGQAATVTPNAAADQVLDAKISAIDPTSTLSGNVVTYAATLTLDRQGTNLRPGQTVNVQATVAEAKDVLYVPSSAVTSRGGADTVTVLREGQEQRVTVQTGLEGDTGTEITSGLQEDDLVVIGTVGTTGTGGGSGTRDGGGFGGGPGGGGFPGGAVPGGGGRGGIGGNR